MKENQVLKERKTELIGCVIIHYIFYYQFNNIYVEFYNLLTSLFIQRIIDDLPV